MDTLSRLHHHNQRRSQKALSYVPGGSLIIGSGIGILTAMVGHRETAQVDIGFDRFGRRSDFGPERFTETALDIDAAVRHIAGDVVSAANPVPRSPLGITRHREHRQPHRQGAGL